DVKVETGAAAQIDHRDAFTAHLFAQLADAVETEHHRIEAASRTSNRLCDQHFGARDLHHVQHEPDAYRRTGHPLSSGYHSAPGKSGRAGELDCLHLYRHSSSRLTRF